MFHGKCIIQYKQLSDSNLPWLPVIPSCLIGFKEIFNYRKYDIKDNFSLDSEYGNRLFCSHLKLPTEISSDQLVCDSFIRDTAAAVQVVKPILQVVQRKAVVEQEMRHADESDGIADVSRYTLADSINTQKQLESIATKDEGLENLMFIYTCIIMFFTRILSSFMFSRFYHMDRLFSKCCFGVAT